MAPVPIVASTATVCAPISTPARAMRVELPRAYDERLNRHIGGDLDLGFDPGGGGVDDRHAGEHVPAVDAVAEPGGDDRELDARVHALDLEALVGAVHRDERAGGDEQPDRVGEVQLALGVSRLEPLERGPEARGGEDVEAGVDLAECELGRARVGGLDDPRERSAPVADDAAVAAHLGRLEREHGGRGVRGAVRLEELGDQLGAQAGDVAGEHEDLARSPATWRRRGCSVSPGSRAAFACTTASTSGSGVARSSGEQTTTTCSASAPRAPRGSPSRPCAGRAAGRRRRAAPSACGCRARRRARRRRSAGRSRGPRRCWLGRQDSNLGSRDQNPLPYRLATPHCAPSIGASPRWNGERPRCAAALGEEGSRARRPRSTRLHRRQPISGCRARSG